jgi:hypothetical protein
LRNKKKYKILSVRYTFLVIHKKIGYDKKKWKYLTYKNVYFAPLISTDWSKV